MASFGRQFGAASPVLTMPPQPSHQAAFNMAGLSHQPALPQKAFGSANFGVPVSSANLSAAPSTSRKRSRDEAAENLEADVPPPAPVQEPEEEWVYGPGMTLIKNTKGYVADASNQSGTWLEEKAAAEEESRRVYNSEKAMLRSSKSQRLDRCLDLSSVQSTAPNVESVSPTNTSFSRAGGPIIDDFTLHLGIGWRKISDDVHIQAAARGWARYIENHYPVTNAQIRLESKGLQSYLVEASEGFFLFAENLRQGRLVSQNVQGALRNLQSSPPTFDGMETLTAAESPSSTGAQRDMPPVDAEMNMY